MASLLVNSHLQILIMRMMCSLFAELLGILVPVLEFFFRKKLHLLELQKFEILFPAPFDKMEFLK